MEIDNHPIPQDVSHFQFKLIGEMSIKQLGYLAGFMILAWIFISLPVPVFVKLPIAAFYAFLGVILAFVPIEGRPADTIFYYFIKALFSPNQYIYQKTSTNEMLSALSRHVIIHTPAVTPVAKTNQAPAKYSNPEPRTRNLNPAPSLTSQPITSAIRASNPNPLTSNQQPVTYPQAVPMQVITNPTPIPVRYMTPPKIPQKIRIVQSVPKPITPQPSLQPVHIPQGPPLKPELEQIAHDLEVSFQKAKLEKPIPASPPKLLETPPPANPNGLTILTNQRQKHLLTRQSPLPPLKPIPIHIKPKPATPATRDMPIVPEFPNLITGIVKDPRGNILPNILIEVKDQSNSPVRAFKTNPLGQFAAATPLPNGTYTLQLEDTTDKHKFAIIEIEAKGQVIPPVEIISTDEREDLRRSLFGNN